MSVKATNALREKLGLKPLEEGGNKKDAAMEESRKERADEEKQMEREIEAERKIEKVRNARLLKEDVKGPTLAQKLKAQGQKAATSSMADWVSHSRDIGKVKETEAAAKRAAELDAQDKAAEYTEKDLAGLAVQHDADDIREGETVIMTLKDSYIVEEEDGELGINSDNDELENVNMAENDRTKDRLELKKKKAFARYTDALQDGDESGALGGGAVLPHYDEVIDGDKKKAKSTFTLGEEGAEDDAKRKKLEAIRAKLAKGGAGAPGQQSKVVNVNTLPGLPEQQGTDYYTNAEMAQFKKPKEKKRRRVRKKKGSVLDELVPLDTHDEDRGTRKNAAKARKDAASEAEAEATKKAGYENAMSKAQEKSRWLADDQMNVEEDDDAQLQKSLAHAQKLTAKKDSGIAMGTENLKASVEVNKQNDPVPAGGDDGGEVIEEMVADDGSLTFTETGEFCKGISTDHLTKRRKVEAADSDDDGAEEDEDEPMDEPESAWVTSSMEISVKNDDGEEVEGDDVDGDGGGIEAEPVVARGLAATLQLARSKGMLQELDTRHGRTNDMKTQVIQERQIKKKEEKSKSTEAPAEKTRDSDRDREHRERRERERERDRRGGRRSRSRSRSPEKPANQRPRQGDIADVHRIDEMMRNRDQLDINYSDAYGRKLSSKEAFRQLCHQFHGIVPGRAKMEKDLKKMEEDKKLSLMHLTDTPLNAVAASQSAREKTGKAFINLDAKKVSEKELKKLKKRKNR
jgi:U4/U6.U5 tri-snRNP-associated protein 1